MRTIDQDVSQRLKYPIDISFMTDYYITENGYFTFPSPEFWTIEQNLFYLLKNSIKKVFDSKYIMKPYLLSFDEYKTVQLSPLLMIINSVLSIEDFNLDNVIIPSYSSIINICKNNIPKKDKSELQKISW